MKNKMKQHLSLLLCLVFALSLSITACASTTNEQNTADALNSLQLFLGMDIDENGNPVYGLDQALTREQGLMLLLRMLGLEETAENYTGAHPFVDVKIKYYEPYIAYAYSVALLKGIDVDKFGGDLPMTYQMFATFCMRSLGYQDGADGDFLYENAIDFARSKGVGITSTNGVFTRGNAVTMFWQTLNTACKDGSQTLAEKLISRGLFSKEDFETAKDIMENGKSVENQGTGTENGGGKASEDKKKNNSSEQKKEELPDLDLSDPGSSGGGGSSNDETPGQSSSGGQSTGGGNTSGDCDHTYNANGICTKCGSSQYELPEL